MHRTGTLRPSDNIVLVVTASEHREAAFRAAEFLMDYLKTRAPFWKRESGPQGSRWVEADARDEIAGSRWNKQRRGVRSYCVIGTPRGASGRYGPHVQMLPHWQGPRRGHWR